jgi:hypothetical protein
MLHRLYVLAFLRSSTFLKKLEVVYARLTPNLVILIFYSDSIIEQHIYHFAYQITLSPTSSSFRIVFTSSAKCLALSCCYNWINVVCLQA